MFGAQGIADLSTNKVDFMNNDNNDNNDNNMQPLNQDGQQNNLRNHGSHHSQSDGTEAEDELKDNGAHLFVDGLLQTYFQTPIERQRRIARVMKSISEPSKLSTNAWMKIIRQGGALITTAALIALMFILSPHQVEASAQAQAVVNAEQKARDRRVIFQLIPPSDRPDGPDFIGTLDIRDAKHLVMTIRQPNGTIEVRGRDGERYWMIDGAGKLHDLPSDMPWPTWVQSPRGGLLVDMAEAVSQGLNEQWKWSHEKASQNDNHLIATRLQDKILEPNKIHVRMNPTTGLATQIEMWWPKNSQRARHSHGEGDKRGPGGEMRGEGRPMRDGAMNGSKGPRPSLPMGPPGKLTLRVEPPITFDAAWFTSEKQLSINAK